MVWRVCVCLGVFVCWLVGVVCVAGFWGFIAVGFLCCCSGKGCSWSVRVSAPVIGFRVRACDSVSGLVVFVSGCGCCGGGFQSPVG